VLKSRNKAPEIKRSDSTDALEKAMSVQPLIENTSTAIYAQTMITQQQQHETLTQTMQMVDNGGVPNGNLADVAQSAVYVHIL
jgi:hypothetical protein